MPRCDGVSVISRWGWRTGKFAADLAKTISILGMLARAPCFYPSPTPRLVLGS
jgi:hypothetical protein